MALPCNWPHRARWRAADHVAMEAQGHRAFGDTCDRLVDRPAPRRQ
ncbi:hypothetical protein FOXB_06894 [Fusarium oxysporum f. sp. conglutinans Fo5176]|uniref:Uncharacterized protein n=1 Tax=Fusarium oxysporum (strain Fo5176) TaxID=660025 RepID=F9FKG5_FUSOF|nr:hypothetical protein FOXB_06894 [Fusarium oxysporum f. sp. conglutinans Fo5176]